MFDPPVPRWSTSTMSRVAWTSANNPGSQPKNAVPARPGPPASAKNASGSGVSASAGMTATRRPIIRPDGFDRSSGTSKTPHTAGAVAVTGASLWIVQSVIGRPASRRAGAAVVGTADVGGALETSGAVVEGTEFAGAALGAGGSDEPHAASNPTHNTPATARLAYASRASSDSRPDTRSGRHHRARRSVQRQGRTSRSANRQAGECCPACVTHHNGRTMSVVDDRAAHRAEEQRAESAPATAADDDQISPLGGLDDRLGGVPLDEPAVNPRSTTRVGSLHGPVQRTAGVDADDIADGGGRCSRARTGTPRRERSSTRRGADPPRRSPTRAPSWIPSSRRCPRQLSGVLEPALLREAAGTGTSAIGHGDVRASTWATDPSNHDAAWPAPVVPTTSNAACSACLGNSCRGLPFTAIPVMDSAGCAARSVATIVSMLVRVAVRTASLSSAITAGPVRPKSTTGGIDVAADDGQACVASLGLGRRPSGGRPPRLASRRTRQ